MEPSLPRFSVSPFRSFLMAGALVFAVGCQTKPDSPPVVTSATQHGAPAPGELGAPAYDSTLTHHEVLLRFQEGIDSVGALSGGASDREGLVRRFVTSLAALDTASLRRMALTKAEYAWIYYPTATMGRPPFDVRADLLWYMVERRGHHGLVEALKQRGGRSLEYVSHRCGATPTVEGENRIWGPCTLMVQEPGGQPTRERLFGLIIERHGQFKFISYSNQLD